MVVAETHGAGARRRRGGRGRLRAAARGLPLGRRDAARRAGDLGRGARQRAGRYLVRRSRGDRPGVRERRPRGGVRLPYRSRDRRAARAARGAGRLRPGERPLHAPCRQRRRGAAEARAARPCSASQPESLRVLSYDVGGNFGTRNRVFVEFGLVLWAARKLGRPVKFTATRSEAFLSDYQGRDLVTKVELALRQDGRFLAMRATNISNVGRALRLALAAEQGLGIDPRLLRHPGRDLARDGGLHQHHADAGLPQLGPPGGDVRDRAADRHRGGAAGHRPDRAAPEESRQAASDALPQRGRHDLRQRPLRGEHGLGDGDRRLEGFRDSAGAKPPSAASCSATDSPTMSSRRSARPTSRRASRSVRRAASTW